MGEGLEFEIYDFSQVLTIYVVVWRLGSARGWHPSWCIQRAPNQHEPISSHAVVFPTPLHRFEFGLSTNGNFLGEFMEIQMCLSSRDAML